VLLYCFAAECTAKEAFQYAGPNIIFASGSPFRDVDLGMGLSPLDLNASLFWYAITHANSPQMPQIRILFLFDKNFDTLICRRW